MILLLLGLFIINSKSHDKREAYIKAVAEWHILLLFAIYGLSIFKSLNVPWVIAFYAVGNIGVWGYVLKKKRHNEIWKINISSIGNKLYIIPCIMALIALGLAIYTKPYNWDSMSYHLPRLAHWIQNESVMPYATHIDRQVGSTTLTSYVTLLVYMFSGKRDIFLNLVQCFAYITNAVFVYGIARKLNANKNFSVAASVLYLAMPIAFVEATTTQNDNYTTMWLLFFVYLLVDFFDKDLSLQYTKSNRDKVVFAAASLGFGYLAKPSVCFAMVIFLFFILWNVIKRKDHYKDIFKLLGWALVSFVVTVLPQFLFNMMVYGKALPDGVGKRQLVGTLQPNYLFLNFMKNFTYNLGNSVITKSKEYLSSFLYGLADICNVVLDDPAISEDGGAYGFSSHPYGCDTALNPLVLFLAIFAVIWCVIRIRKQGSKQVQFTLFTMIAYIVFCVFLRWEHYISRYLAAYFALFCPMIAIQFQDFYGAIKNMNIRRIVVVALCVICAVNYYLAVENVYKIETKEYPDSYFYHVGGWKNDYVAICDNIVERQYKTIGYIVEPGGYEYPLWGLLNSRMDDFRVEHIEVENELSRYEDKTFTPDCIFAIDRRGADSMVVNGCEYQKIMSLDEYKMYLYEKQ